MILVLVVAALPFFLLYSYCLSRSVLLGWISLLTLQLLNYAFGFNSGQMVGPIHLYVLDILEFSLLVAGLLRTMRRLRERNTSRVYLAAFLIVLAFSLFRGILAYGIPATGNQARMYTGFLIAFLYFLTAPVDSESVRKYVRVFLYFGLGLVFVALLASFGLHIGGITWATDDLAPLDGRLLNADSASAFALCFFFSIGERYHRNSVFLSKWLPGVFFISTLLMRHRTVWAVFLVGLVLIFYKDRVIFRRLVPAGLLALCLLAGYFSIVAGKAAKSTETQLQDSATNDDTWVWRVAGWEQLILGEQQSLTSVLLGRGIGGGYERFDPTHGQYTDAPPHSEYVTQLFTLGAAGLVVVLCLMIRPLRRLLKISSINVLAVEPSASVWAAVVVGLMVYSVAYDPPPEMYALLGIANAIVVRWDKESGSISKSTNRIRRSRTSSQIFAEPQELIGESHGEHAPPVIPDSPGFA